MAFAVAVLTVSTGLVAALLRAARDGTPGMRLAAAFVGGDRDGSAPPDRREG